MSWEVSVLLLIAGVVGGLVSGLLGIGGGIIYILVIPYALDYWNIPPEWHAQVIVANSLAAIFFSSLSANYTHYTKGYFFVRPVAIIGLAAIVSSWLSLKYLVHTPLFSMKPFLVFLLLLLLYMLFATLRGAAKVTDNSTDTISIQGMIGIGLLSGLVASASGLGGGIIVIPLLNRLYGINIRKAGAIAMGAIMLSSFTMTLLNAFTPVPQTLHGSIGLIIPAICLSLSLSVVITSSIGVRMAHKLPPRWISLIYAGFLLLIIIEKTISLLVLTGYLA